MSETSPVYLNKWRVFLVEEGGDNALFKIQSLEETGFIDIRVPKSDAGYENMMRWSQSGETLSLEVMRK